MIDEREQEQADAGREQRDGRPEHDLGDAVHLLLELRRQQLEARLRDADAVASRCAIELNSPLIGPRAGSAGSSAELSTP